MTMNTITPAPQEGDSPQEARAGLRGMNRRAFLTVGSVAALGSAVAAPAASALPADPILAHYRAWCAARNDWFAATPAESDEACEREWAAVDAMIATPPSTPAGVAALAHLLWAIEGPCARDDSLHYETQCNERDARIFATLWRFGTGREGLPPYGGTPFEPSEVEAFALTT